VSQARRCDTTTPDWRDIEEEQAWNGRALVLRHGRPDHRVVGVGGRGGLDDQELEGAAEEVRYLPDCCGNILINPRSTR
jgi:hypothetical protein